MTVRRTTTRTTTRTVPVRTPRGTKHVPVRIIVKTTITKR